MLQSGRASWYGPGFHGRKTASGERFDMYELTAAHKTLPLGTRVMVRNPANGKEVVVRINDRGPYAHGRILDLSKAAASQLGLIHRGHGEVVLQALGEGDATGATGLTSRLASADVDDERTSPSRSQHAQMLAQTRFGDSSQALGEPLPRSEPLPNWPMQEALTGLPVMTPPPVGLAAAGQGPRMGLNGPSWDLGAGSVPKLAFTSEPAERGSLAAAGEANAVAAAAAVPAPAAPAPGAQAVAQGSVAERLATPDRRVIDAARIVPVRHVPAAIAVGDLALSGDPSLRLAAPVMPAGGESAAAALAAPAAADLATAAVAGAAAP